jgi:hypothetical protein
VIAFELRQAAWLPILSANNRQKESETHPPIAKRYFGCASTCEGGAGAELFVVGVFVGGGVVVCDGVDAEGAVAGCVAGAEPVGDSAAVGCADPEDADAEPAGAVDGCTGVAGFVPGAVDAPGAAPGGGLTPGCGGTPGIMGCGISVTSTSSTSKIRSDFDGIPG